MWFYDRITAASSNSLAHFRRTIGDWSVCTDFFVIKKDHSAFLSLKAAEDLGLIKRNIDAVTNNSSSTIIDEFPQLLQGTGHVQREYRITLREGDPVPMEAEGIIEKVSSPTDWVSPLAIVLKKDSMLRVCVDPREN